MKIYFFVIILVTAVGTVTAHVQVDNFMRRIFDKTSNSYANVVYFIMSCQENYSKIAIRLFAELEHTAAVVGSGIVTVPVHQRTIKPLLFAKNVGQMSQVLENHACFANTEQSPRYDNTYTIILKILPLLHRKDSVLLFTSFDRSENDNSKVNDSASANETAESALIQQLLLKEISINILLLENSNLPAQLKTLAEKTEGSILTYSDTEELRSHQPSEATFTASEQFTQPDYEISVVEKELKQNTRTLLKLPENTFQIFLTLYGDIRKASLITPSGIVINVLPVDDAQAQLPPTGPTRDRSINFNSLIRKSPTTSTWSLSANGHRYNITFMTMNTIQTNVSSDRHEYEPRTPVASQQRWARRQDLVESGSFFDEQFNHVDIENSNVFGYQRTNLLPTIIDVDFQSTFFVLPGEDATVLINVKNNKPFSSDYHFRCVYPQRPCGVRPMFVSLIPQQSIQVLLLIKAEGTEGSSNIITFVSQDVQIVHRKIYLYIGKQKSDSNKPDIDYEYNGNCDDANAGNTCHRKRWSAEVVARDTGSGLLNFWSEPVGLIYTAEYIVGTRDHVTARYSASCCEPKVDISAMDLRGNTRKITLDVEHQYLNWTEIVAIVLGVILLILIIVMLVYFGLRWRRKKNERSFLNN